MTLQQVDLGEFGKEVRTASKVHYEKYVSLHEELNSILRSIMPSLKYFCKVYDDIEEENEELLQIEEKTGRKIIDLIKEEEEND